MKKKPAAVANLQVTYKRVPIDSLFEDPANARKHGERNLETISNSLRCFGQVESLVVQKSTGKVIGGNGRLRVMKDLGWDEVDIAEVDITDVQSVSLGIALNRTAELAEWDDEILAATLNGLALEEGLLEAAGYDEEELAAMLAEIDDAAVGDVTEDEVPEPPADPITKPGDLWILGRHRVLCGDSTKAEDVARLMDGRRAQLVHADPPYGMGKEKDGVQNDNLYRDKLDAFQMAWWRVFRKHTDDNGSAYIWGNAEDLWRLWYVGGLKDSERLTFRSQVIWDKPPSASAWGSPIGSEVMRSYTHGYEVCLFFMLGEQ